MFLCEAAIQKHKWCKLNLIFLIMLYALSCNIQKKKCIWLHVDVSWLMIGWLDVKKLLCFMTLKSFMTKFIFVIVCSLFVWKQICANFFIVLFFFKYLYCHWKSNYQRRRVWINRFKTAIFLCLSQARTWISNVICCGLIYVQWIEVGEVGEVVVYFVDGGGIVD